MDGEDERPQGLAHLPLMSSGNWTLLDGGDHGGLDWIISNNTTAAGHHYNISTFQVSSGAVLRVKTYDGANSSFGNFSVNATTIQVAGIINATGSGYSGGAGGAGNIGGGSGGAGGSGPGAGSAGSQGHVAGNAQVGRGGGGGGGSSAYFTGGGGGLHNTGGSGTAPPAIYSRFAPVQAMGSGGGGGGGGGGRNNQYPGTQGDPGGSGGGSIDFNADVITISGSISTDGESGGSFGLGGVNPWGDTGMVGAPGGGAAAGTQFFSSRIFNLTGNLSAQGGSGAKGNGGGSYLITDAGAGSDSAISVEDVSTIEFDSQATLRGIVIWPGGGSWLPLEGGDHGGQPWIISSNSTAAGYHYNISNFIIQQNVSLLVEPYNGSVFGNLSIEAQSVDINGILNATDSGYLGGQNAQEGGSGHGAGSNSGYGPGRQGSSWDSSSCCWGGVGGGAASYGGEGNASSTWLNGYSHPSGGIYGTIEQLSISMGSGARCSVLGTRYHVLGTRH